MDPRHACSDYSSLQHWEGSRLDGPLRVYIGLMVAIVGAELKHIDVPAALQRYRYSRGVSEGEP